MLKKILLCLISTVILSSCNISNSSVINNNSLKINLKDELTDINTQYNKKYWNEFLPTIKCDAKETLKERFDYCSNWIIGLLTSKSFYYKVCSFNRYKYDMDSIDDVIDIKSFINEIQNRKRVLNDINCKNTLNGNAWSEVPLRILSYNEDHRNYIGQYLNWYCKLLSNHWDMKFDKNYSNVKLNFYASYEYQEPQFYKESLNSERVLSICLSAIEMDLLTSNRLTSNIELFANYLISRKDNVAKAEVARYRKYFTDKQNELLANHIVSYYLSFSGEKKINVAKYLATYYILDDLFNNIKPNKFLDIIRKNRPENWFEVIIKKYLDNEFGTNYNKSYLTSFKKVILENKEDFKNTIFPKFRKYVTSVFRKLVETNNKIINLNDNYLEIRDKNKLIFPNTDEEYKSSLKVLKSLNCASGKVGLRNIDNIISYINLEQKYKK